jgi:uncharacterized YccA/Bax inhibitor family protein
MIKYKNLFLASQIYPKTMDSSKYEMSLNRSILVTLYHLFIVMLLAHWVLLNRIEDAVLIGFIGVGAAALLTYFIPRMSHLSLLLLAWFYGYLLGGLGDFFREEGLSVITQTIFLSMWIYVAFFILHFLKHIKEQRTKKFNWFIVASGVVLLAAANNILIFFGSLRFPFILIGSVFDLVVILVIPYFLVHGLYSDYYAIKKISENRVKKHMSSYAAVAWLFSILFVYAEPFKYVYRKLFR